MAVKIRLSKTGRKNRSSFRIIAADTRFPRDGRLIEVLGHYDPHEKDEQQKFQFDRERVDYWWTQGAQLTESVFAFFKKRYPELIQRIRERKERQLAKKR